MSDHELYLIEVAIEVAWQRGMGNPNESRAEVRHTLAELVYHIANNIDDQEDLDEKVCEELMYVEQRD